MHKKELLDRLTGATIAQGLSRGELERLCASAEVVAFAEGETVIIEGERSQSCYVVLNGQMQVFLPQERGPNRFSDIPLNALGPGDCCGEYALIDGGPASASVVAAEPTLALKLEKTAFEAALVDQDTLARKVYGNLLHILVARLRAKDRELDLMDVPGRG